MKTITKIFVLILLIIFVTSCGKSSPTISQIKSQTPTIIHNPTSSLSPSPVITLAEDPAPIFPESGIMKSEHITASLSKKWMDNAGIGKVTLDSEILELIYESIMIHWASSLSNYRQDKALQSIAETYTCFNKNDLDDPSRKSHLENVIKAYKLNSQDSERFNFYFDFGQGVKGKVMGLDIKALGSKEEYLFVIDELKKDGIEFTSLNNNSTDDKQIIFFDAKNTLNVYSWDGNPIKMKYIDSPNKSQALEIDLFTALQVSGGYIIGETQKHHSGEACSGFSIADALNCSDLACRKLGKIPSNFIITFRDGTVIAPTKIHAVTIYQTPTPIIYIASKEPIEISGYSLILSNVIVSDFDFNPFGLVSNRALHLDVTEENGKIQEVSQLQVWFTDDKGRKIEHSIIERVNGSVNGEQVYRWIAYTSQSSQSYYLHFPSGEVIDLTPLLNK